jgi:hypothetical protein
VKFVIEMRIEDLSRHRDEPAEWVEVRGPHGRLVFSDEATASLYLLRLKQTQPTTEMRIVSLG